VLPHLVKLDQSWVIASSLAEAASLAGRLNRPDALHEAVAACDGLSPTRHT
jgi:hypothetical protein